jgi:spore cortex biosynthesis protein YabQ
MDATLNQPYIFLTTVYSGLLLGLLYDIYRGIRIMMNRKKWITILSDCLFALCCLIVVTGVLYIVNSGNVRLYTFIGFSLGFSLYIVGLSPLFMYIAGKIIAFLSKGGKDKARE